MAINNKSEKAFKVFNKLGGKQYAETQVNEILSTKGESSNGNIKLKSLFQGKMKKIIIIGIVIAVLQQWCGINVIFNYAQEIFSSAGYHVSDMLFNIVITGIVNVIFTFVGMYTVDRLGRKSLMLLGTVGLTSIYAILGAGYYFKVTGIPMLILVVLAIACYAMTLAPITWVVISELFPNRVRAKAMAISTFALWTACFILTFSFPLLNKGLGAYGTFWLYGLICLSGFFFLRKNLPETKGKSLEEIEKEIVG
jgi:SP family sugar porter-like MFS transporter